MALATGPFLSPAWENAPFRGQPHGACEEHRLAVADFTRVIELAPDFAQAYYDRGLLYWRELGNPERSLRDLSRFIELRPTCAEAWFKRVLAFQMLALQRWLGTLACTRDKGKAAGSQMLNHRCGIRSTASAIADYEHYLDGGHDAEWDAISRRRLQDLRSEVKEDEQSSIGRGL